MKNFRLRLIVLMVVGMLAAFIAMPGFAAEAYSYQGHGGTMGHLPFYLIGGQYQIYVRAQLPIEYIRSGVSHSCVFSAVFEWPTSETVVLGHGTTISTTVPYKLQTTLHALPGGVYHFWTAGASNCDWVINIASTSENTAGIAPVQMVRTTGGNVQLSTTTSLSDKMQFFAQFRTEHGAPATVSGVVQIIHDGQIIGTLPLSNGLDSVTRSSEFFVDMQWRASDAKYLGKNTAKFIVKIGSSEFTSSEEFTLTP